MDLADDPVVGIGPHAGYLLRLYGAHIDRAFGEVPYQVGSSLTQKSGFRDVDVRVMLSDENYKLYADPHVRKMHELAWTVFGQHLTGLPIDFQIQETSAANREFDGQRSALVLLSSELPTVRDD